MRPIPFLAALTLSAMLAGCGREEKAPPPAPKPAAEHAHDHDHDHDHGHSHGHAHKAPHGGTLAVLGDEFAHLEFVFDPKSAELTAYVLDGSAEKGVRIPQRYIDLAIKSGADTVTVALEAQGNTLSGETPGNSSVFKAKVEKLAGATAFDITLAEISIKGQKFTKVAIPFPKGNH